MLFNGRFSCDRISGGVGKINQNVEVSYGVKFEGVGGVDLNITSQRIKSGQDGQLLTFHVLS